MRHIGIEFRAPLKTSAPLAAVIERLRQSVPPLDQDRFLAPDLEQAAELVRSGVLLDTLPERLLEDLRRAEVERIDVLLAHRGTRSQGRMVAAVHDRHAVALVLAPAHHQVVTARTPPAGMEVRTGPVGIRVDAVKPELDVTILDGP